MQIKGLREHNAFCSYRQPTYKRVSRKFDARQRKAEQRLFAHPNISPLRNLLRSTSFTASQNASFFTLIPKQSLRSQTIEQILEACIC